jgi:hypothetical protein
LVPEGEKPAIFEFKQAKQFISLHVFSIQQRTAICKVPLSKPRKVEESTPATFQIVITHIAEIEVSVM